MYERMQAGELYHDDDPELEGFHRDAVRMMDRFNRGAYPDMEAVRELLGGCGADSFILPPLRCDFGRHTTIGARTFISFGLVLLDPAPITIGDDVKIGPNVQLLTATHPLDPKLRQAGWQSGEAITIGDNVWLGGGVIVCPGVSIGANTVVGAGSVVTADLPANVLAVGSPARVLRTITEAPGAGTLTGTAQSETV
jgi:maltose O-acetyltransferase